MNLYAIGKYYVLANNHRGARSVLLRARGWEAVKDQEVQIIRKDVETDRKHGIIPTHEVSPILIGDEGERNT